MTPQAEVNDPSGAYHRRMDSVWTHMTPLFVVAILLHSQPW